MLCCTSTTVQMNYTYSKHMVRACSWFFLFLFVLFLCIACRISSGGAHDLVAYASSGSGGGGGVFPSFGLPFAIRTYNNIRLFFGVSSFPFSCASIRRFFFSFNVPVGCWRAYVLPVVSSTMAWHCLAYSLHRITMYCCTRI